MSCVRGSTIGHDVSQRTWQLQDGSLWREALRDLQAHGPLARHGARPPHPGDHDPDAWPDPETRQHQAHALRRAQPSRHEQPVQHALSRGCRLAGGGGRDPDHAAGGRGGNRDQRYRSPQELYGGRGRGRLCSPTPPWWHGVESTMQLGLFMMPQHPPTRTLYASWERDLALVRLADQLGYHEAWIGEHITETWENAPVPELLIAQALTMARQIALGTGVTLLPLHNPVDVAHRIAMLDHMAQGRFYWGVGVRSIPSDL